MKTLIIGGREFHYRRKLDYIAEIGNELPNDRQLITEYDRLNANNTLNGMKIYIYKADRDRFVPHLHIYYGKISIEVSLLDWAISKVNYPDGFPCDWSSFTDVRDRFFPWLKGKEEKVFFEWDKSNPDNPLADYADSDRLTQEARDYIERFSNPIQIDAMYDEIVSILNGIGKNSIEWYKMESDDEVTVLRKIGAYTKYHLDNAPETCLKAACDAVREVRAERSIDVSKYSSDLYDAIYRFLSQDGNFQRYRQESTEKILKDCGLYDKYNMASIPKRFKDMAEETVRIIKQWKM